MALILTLFTGNWFYSLFINFLEVWIPTMFSVVTYSAFHKSTHSWPFQTIGWTAFSDKSFPSIQITGSVWTKQVDWYEEKEMNSYLFCCVVMMLSRDRRDSSCVWVSAGTTGFLTFPKQLTIKTWTSLPHMPITINMLKWGPSHRYLMYLNLLSQILGYL